MRALNATRAVSATRPFHDSHDSASANLSCAWDRPRVSHKQQTVCRTTTGAPSTPHARKSKLHVLTADLRIQAHNLHYVLRQGGLDSGFMHYDNSTGNGGDPPTFNITIKDTNPIYLFCAQDTPRILDSGGNRTSVSPFYATIDLKPHVILCHLQALYTWDGFLN